VKTFNAFLVATVVLVSGCAGGGAGGNKKLFGGKNVPRPKEPPAVPARKDEPLDRSLVEAARQEVTAAAASDDPVLRENAVEAARGLKDPVATPIILRGLNDAQRVVRFRAALGAGEHRLAEARPPLEAMVDRNDNDQHLRIACIFALHRLGVTDYTHDLEKTAVDDEPGVRGDTAFVLGLLGEKSALKIFDSCSENADWIEAKIAERDAQEAERLAQEAAERERLESEERERLAREEADRLAAQEAAEAAAAEQARLAEEEARRAAEAAGENGVPTNGAGEMESGVASGDSGSINEAEQQ